MVRQRLNGYCEDRTLNREVQCSCNSEEQWFYTERNSPETGVSTCRGRGEASGIRRNKTEVRLQSERLVV